MHSFDLGSHSYVQPMVTYLQRKFPGRLNVTLGNSMKTVPRYFVNSRSTPRLTCDLIVVDGGHKYDVPRSDILNFARVASHPYNVIIVDDINRPYVRTAWEIVLRSKVVQQYSVFKCPPARTFAVGVVR